MKKIHHTITPTDVERQQAGATRIAPGIWRDARGYVHFSIPEILDYVGLEHTPENIAKCERHIAAIIKAFSGDTSVIMVRQHVGPIE